jgi:Na+/proline symporter
MATGSTMRCHFFVDGMVDRCTKVRRFTEHLDSVTVPDFIGFRYGSDNARLIAAVIVIFSSFLYMTAVFKGAGNLLQSFLDMSYELAIFVVLIIVMLYTAVGGFISSCQN